MSLEDGKQNSFTLENTFESFLVSWSSNREYIAYWFPISCSIYSSSKYKVKILNLKKGKQCSLKHETIVQKVNWLKNDNKIITYSNVVKIFIENIENGEWYLSKNIASSEFSLLCEYSKFEGAKGLNSTDHEVFN